MYGLRDTPPEIEKIRKAQWSPENTAKTQAVVSELDAQRKALRLVTGNSKVVEAMTAAIKRFIQLDPNVTEAS